MTVCVVEFEGELDIFASTDIHAKLAACEGHDLAIVDLTHVGYLDSTILGALAHTANRLHGATEFRLVVADPRLLQIFALTQMNRAFEIFQTREEALRKVGVEHE